MSCSKRRGFDEYRFRKVSRKVFNRCEKRRKQKLKDRMDALTKSIDNTEPEGYGFFQKGEFKKASREREQMKIALENEIIKSRRVVTGKGIDNVNTSLRYGTKKTNIKERERFRHRVNHDNRIISERLKAAKASINVRKFESEHRKHKNLITKMSEFSRFRRRRKKTKTRMPWIDPRPQTAPSKFSSSVRSPKLFFDVMNSKNESRRPNTSHIGHSRNMKFVESRRDQGLALDIDLATSAKIHFGDQVRSVLECWREF